ncbi:MAG TPA: hypothetical protein VGR24_00245 [bacterium]|jgi:hypothetical protein|nr:hypothetical protein [bacterium]
MWLIGLVRRLKIHSARDLYFLVMAFLLPIHLVPVFRKGVTVFHVINAVLLVVLLFAALNRRERLRWPLLLPLWMIFLGSLIGMFNSQVLGINVYTLLQDVYLYLWAVALIAMLADQRDMDYLTTAWLFASIAVMASGFILGGDVVGLQVFRDEFTFRNPNRAAAYFMTSLFLLFAPALRGLRLLRVLVAGALLWAIWLTGSVGTFTSVLAGGAIMIFALSYARGTAYWWIPRQVLMLLIAGAMVYVNVAFDIEAALVSRFPHAFGRTPRSAAARQLIWGYGFDEFGKHPLGIGPASFAGQVYTGFSKDGRIELHSDFLATLVERGPIGFAGLLILIGGVALALMRLLGLARRIRSPDLSLWAAALCGVCAAYVVYALSHEALHHDTLWMVIAFVFAQVKIAQAQLAGAQRAGPVPVAVATRLVPTAPGRPLLSGP